MVRYNAHVNLKQWAERQGVSYATARRWFAAGKLPVPAERVGGLILVHEPDEIPAAAAFLIAACARAYGAGDAAARAHAAIDEAAADA